MSGGAFAALKSLTNSGKMGGDSSLTNGPFYGGGARTQGITFGSQGITGIWLIGAVLAAVVLYVLLSRIGG